MLLALPIPELMLGLVVSLAALLLARLPRRPPQGPTGRATNPPPGPAPRSQNEPYRDLTDELARRELARRQRKAKRVAAAGAKERVRSAMRALDKHGYYVFDELVVDAAGLIDHLAVGPRGVFILITSDVPGTVAREPETDEILADGAPLEDEDLRDRALDLSSDVGTELFSDADPLRLPGPVCCVICFTRASVVYDDQNGDPFGIISVWDLLDVFRAEHPRVMPPDTVRRLAELTERLYRRPPYVFPNPGPQGRPPSHGGMPHELELEDEDR